jgi:hypothetical protein
MTMRQLTTQSLLKTQNHRPAWTMIAPLVIWAVPLPWSAI